jgi:hypothetical protein
MHRVHHPAGEESPAGQPADLRGGEKALSPLLSAVRELLRNMDEQFDAINAKFEAFQPNEKLELDALGMAQLLKTTLPSISTEVLCYLLVHLDEVVEPAFGRATLNELYTALKWFAPTLYPTVLLTRCLRVSYRPTAARRPIGYQSRWIQTTGVCLNLPRAGLRQGGQRITHVGSR